jgi:hypothetical protein
MVVPIAERFEMVPTQRILIQELELPLLWQNASGYGV